jgi:hypothetical protein
VFDVNVTGPFCRQAFARHRIKAGARSIVNITTGSVQSPRPAAPTGVEGRARTMTRSPR